MNKVPALVSVALLAAAVAAQWPYGFYVFLRIAVCASAAYLAFEAAKLAKTAWAWVMGGMAVLFNPLIRVPLPRADWQVVDFVAGLVLLASIFGIRRTIPGKKGAREIHQR